MRSLRRRRHLQDPDLDWPYVHLVRELCLDRPIEPEQRRALVREGLLGEDGALDPSLAAVVRAAVRGEDRLLRLDSPFTHSLDRAMADYLCARTFIRGHLEDAAAEAFLSSDPSRDAEQEFRERTTPAVPPPHMPPPWTDREADRRDRPADDLPPH